MKILITGAKGQLGNELIAQLEAGKSVLGNIPAALENAEIVAVDVDEMDVCKLAEVQKTIGQHRPEVVIHCAAFTNVDACEEQKDVAFAVNVLGARNVALACESIGAKLVHISTDYVFSGEGSTPFSEAHRKAPSSVYGETKHLGEEYVARFCSKIFIVRTSWLYGKQGGNFVKTILKLASERDSIKVVNDQIGNPTNAEDLAHHLLKICQSEEYGIYHCTGKGICSWFDFASEIVRLAGLKAQVHPCTTAEFPRAAKRPEYSALEHTMLRLTVGDEMRPWQDAIKAYIQEIA